MNLNEKLSAETQEQSCKSGVNSSILLSTGTSMRILLPLEIRFEPKEDITTFELAKCLPYLLNRHGVMPFQVDKTENHFRHFVITDHNR
jgi:hypothetical protein